MFYTYSSSSHLCTSAFDLAVCVMKCVEIFIMLNPVKLIHFLILARFFFLCDLLLTKGLSSYIEYLTAEEFDIFKNLLRLLLLSHRPCKTEFHRSLQRSVSCREDSGELLSTLRLESCLCILLHSLWQLF